MMHFQSSDETEGFVSATPTYTEGVVAPNFLDLNATVHENVLSAIAELIDNSVDAKATRVDINLHLSKQQLTKGDKGMKGKCLSITDDGCGMSDQVIEKMLVGFGRTTKRGEQKAIGQFGIGFKSGSMRIGLDVLVLTKTLTAMSVGLLSQGMLFTEGCESVKGVIVTWSVSDQKLLTPNAAPLLQTIERYAILDQEGLFALFRKYLGGYQTGTHIIIYHLRKEGRRDELQLTPDRDICVETKARRLRPGFQTGVVPKIDWSLREYCQVLYLLPPQADIYINGQKVEYRNLRKSLSPSRCYRFQLIRASRSNNSQTPRQACTLGISEQDRASGHYGLFLYHRNRLIQSYVRLPECPYESGDTLQRMFGLIGVIECNYLTPKSNKQEFRNDLVLENVLHIVPDLLDKFWDEFVAPQRLLKQEAPQKPALDTDNQPQSKRDRLDEGQTPKPNMTKKRKLNERKKGTNNANRSSEDRNKEHMTSALKRKASNCTESSYGSKKQKPSAVEDNEPWEGDLFFLHNGKWKHVTHLTSPDEDCQFLKEELHIKKMAPVAELVATLGDLSGKKALSMCCLPKNPHDSYEYTKFFRYLADKENYVAIGLGDKTLYLMPPDSDSFDASHKLRCFLLPKGALKPLDLNKLPMKKKLK